MSLPEKEPCSSCDGTRVLKVVRDGFTVTEDCPRCAKTDGLEPQPSARELEEAGQTALFGSEER
jgi:hypothetical protein